MRFVSAEIYGFGKWVDATFDFTKQSLVSLYGENESGKSTLQQFIMYMLFDLSPSQLKHFKPKNSTKTGGKLTIEDEVIGVYTIERVGKKLTCHLPNGESQDKEWLEAQLNGLTREIYMAIYSFSAVDLAGIRKMKETDLSEVLFSVGLTGATNIYTLERQLETKLGDLFKARGKIPQINEQMVLLENLHRKVHTFRENEASYRFKCAEKERLTAELTVCQAEVKHVQQAFQTYEKIEQMLPTIQDYYVTVTELDSFTKNLRFPEDGINRYQYLKDKRLPVMSEYRFLMDNQTSLKDKQMTLQEQLLPAHVLKFGQEIVAQKQTAIERKHQLQQVTMNIMKQNQLLKQTLMEIELEERDLDSVSLPFHLENKWQEIAEKNRRLTYAKKELDESQELINNEQHRLKEDMLQLQEKSMVELEVQQLNEKVTAYEANIRQADEQNVLQSQFSNWEASHQKQSKMVLISSISIAIGLCIASYFLSNYILLGVGAIVGILGVGQVFTTKKSVRELAQLTNHPTAMKDLHTMTDVKYRQVRDTLDQQDTLEQALQQIHHELQRVNNEHLQWHDKQSIYAQQAQYLAEELATERRIYPFLTTIEPVHWVGYLQLLKKAKELFLEKVALTSEYELLQANELSLQNKLRQFSQFILLEEQQLTVEAVEKIIHDAADNQQTLDNYVDRVHENSEVITRLKESIHSYDREIGRLFIYANVESEEAYLRLAEEIRKYHDLKDRKAQITQQLGFMFDSEMTRKILQQEIDLKNLAYILKELVEKRETTQNLEIELRDALVKLEVDINQMESSDDYSAALFRLQLERDKLNEAAEKWAVLKVVETVLMKAKNSYQQKYLGAVMKITSRYFKQLTNGLYVTVFAPKERGVFQVETARFDKFTVEELSQGTVDQLYIALRLSISKVMSEKYAIPLIVDDAFVHFDEARRGQGIALLEEIAKEQQVLLFTCQHHLAVETNAIHIHKEITI